MDFRLFCWHHHLCQGSLSSFWDMLFRTLDLHFCWYVLSGKYEYCQGKVREMSGNFEEACCYEPWSHRGQWVNPQHQYISSNRAEQWSEKHPTGTYELIPSITTSHSNRAEQWSEKHPTGTYELIPSINISPVTGLSSDQRSIPQGPMS